jgi:hypothetical protein
VGSRRVTWNRLTGEDAVRVEHEGAYSILDIVLGYRPGWERYDVRLVRIGSGSGRRVAWECPECGRSCARLYLPTWYRQLACRVCYELLYNSQFRRRNRRINVSG